MAVDKSNLPKKVLLIDDDQTVTEAADSALRKHGIQVVRAHDFETAVYLFNQQIFEVVIVELEFAPLPGLAVVQKFRASTNAERRTCGVIMASGNQRKQTDDGLGRELGDIDFVDKPLTDLKLLPALARALSRRRAVTDYDMVKSISHDIYAKTKDVDQAVAPIKSNLPKLQTRGLQLMAQLYEEAGSITEALNLIDALLAKKPDDIALINAKARVLLKGGRAAEAKEYFEKADKAAPKNIDRIRAMAEMYLAVQDPNASVDKMRELINLNPEHRDLKFDLIRDLENAGYIEHAVGLCRETTPAAEVVRYYNNKGVLLSKASEHESAVKEYESALKFYPTFKENYRIYFNVAIAEANQKTVDSLKKARASLQRCLALNPEFEKARTLLQQIDAALQNAA